MPHTRSRRDGFALAIAIAALVVIGALIAGVFFSSTQQFRIGRNTLRTARALTMAEYGVSALLDPSRPDGTAWNGLWNNAEVGIEDTIILASHGGVDTVQVTKLNATNFFVSSVARVPGADGAHARRAIGTLVVLDVPAVTIHGALASRGAVTVGGTALIDGNDTPIPGWDCPPAGNAVPGIAVADSSAVTRTGCVGCVSGNPPIAQDSSAARDGTYRTVDDATWTILVRAAKRATVHRPAPSDAADGSCDRSDPANWGDPERMLPSGTCDTYFPVLYAPGDLSLQEGAGQGVLLVQGDLTVTGTFAFYGLVIVKGMLRVSGTGDRFSGGVMAATVTLDQRSVLEGAMVHYSSCALSRALRGAAHPRAAWLRPWVQLS